MSLNSPILQHWKKEGKVLKIYQKFYQNLTEIVSSFPLFIYSFSIFFGKKKKDNFTWVNNIKYNLSTDWKSAKGL